MKVNEILHKKFIAFKQQTAESLGHSWRIVKESPRKIAKITESACASLQLLFLDSIEGSLEFSYLLFSLRWIPYSEKLLGAASLGFPNVYTGRMRAVHTHRKVQCKLVSKPHQHGMGNTGTDCFIISVLQALRSCSHFADDLENGKLSPFPKEKKELFALRKMAKTKLLSILKESLSKDITSQEIGKFRSILYNYEYQKHFRSVEKQATANLRNRHGVFSAKKKDVEVQRLLKSRLQISKNEQQDVQEFLSYILNLFQMDTSHYFINEEVLTGGSTQGVKTPQVKYTRDLVDSIHISPLYQRCQTYDKVTSRACIPRVKNHLTSFLTQDIQKIAQAKGSSPAIKETKRGFFTNSLLEDTTQKELPEILPVHVLRYSDKGRKIYHSLPFSETIELPIFQTEAIEVETAFEGFSGVQATNKKIGYHLKAVVINVGTSLTRSHYMTYIKENSKWLLYDDDKVKKAKNPSQAIHDIEVNGCLYFFEKGELISPETSLSETSSTNE